MGCKPLISVNQPDALKLRVSCVSWVKVKVVGEKLRKAWILPKNAANSGCENEYCY